MLNISINIYKSILTITFLFINHISKNSYITLYKILLTK